MSDLVPLSFSNKVASPGYNGANYFVSKVGTPPVAPIFLALVYNATTGNWSLNYGNGNPVGFGPTSGAWTTSPGTSYEFYMTGSITEPPVGPFPGPTYEGVPVATWTPISGVSTTLARVEQPTVNAQGAFEATFTLLVRKVGTTIPEITTTITLSYEYAV